MSQPFLDATGFVAGDDLLCSTFTFWRFMIHIPLGPHEMQINYSVNNGIGLSFFVPGRDENMRWAAYSVSRVFSFSTEG